MATRKSISKKLRFDIFKRDGFACQYCGKKAPDVVLEVDHIEPVSKGGTNNELNLVTSCYDCNRGKTNIKLSDNSAIERQKKQLEELNEKQEQLKMLLKWRSGLLKIEDQQIQIAHKAWTELTGYSLNELGLNQLKKTIKEFGISSVLDSIDICSRYLEYKKDRITKESVEFAFNKIKGISYINSLPEEKRIEYQIIGNLKKRMQYKFYNCNMQAATILINRFIKAGYTTSELERIIDDSDKYTDFYYTINGYL